MVCCGTVELVSRINTQAGGTFGTIDGAGDPQLKIKGSHGGPTTFFSFAAIKTKVGRSAVAVFLGMYEMQPRFIYLRIGAFRDGRPGGPVWF